MAVLRAHWFDVSCSLEYYSRQPEGALIVFNWIFLVEKLDVIGSVSVVTLIVLNTANHCVFGPEVIDARIPCDLFDHPIFLIP